MPLAPRIPNMLKIGAHVSVAKGVFNAIPNAVHIGYPPLLSTSLSPYPLSALFIIPLLRFIDWIVANSIK